MQTYKIIKEGSEPLLIVSQILFSLHGLVRQGMTAWAFISCFLKSL